MTIRGDILGDLQLFILGYYTLLPFLGTAAYSNYWSSQGSITYMKLYDVSVKDGSYNIVTEGTLNQVAVFLAQ